MHSKLKQLKERLLELKLKTKQEIAEVELMGMDKELEEIAKEFPKVSTEIAKIPVSERARLLNAKQRKP